MPLCYITKETMLYFATVYQCSHFPYTVNTYMYMFILNKQLQELPIVNVGHGFWIMAVPTFF